MKTLFTIAQLMSFFSNMQAQKRLNSETERKLNAKPIDRLTGLKSWFYSDFRSSAIYIKKLVPLGSIVELIDSNTKIQEGVSSTEGGEIINPHKVFGIQVGIETVATANALVNLGDGTYTSDMPAQLLNAEFRITQGDRLFTMLGRELINAGDTDVNNRYFAPWPFGVGNVDKIKVSIHPAPGAKQDAANLHYVDFQLKTIELYLA
jgi:hypothetical protein